MGFHLSVIETRRPRSANSPPPSWSLYFLYSPRSDLSLGVQSMGFHLSVIGIRRPGSANSPPPSWFLYFLFSPRNTLSLGVQYMGFHLIVIETRSPGSANSPPSLLVQQDLLICAGCFTFLTTILKYVEVSFICKEGRILLPVTSTALTTGQPSSRAELGKILGHQQASGG